MEKRRLRTWLALLVIAGAAFASLGAICGDDDETIFPTIAPRDTAVVPTIPPAPTFGPPPSPTPCPSFEGCYTQAQMPAFFAEIERLVSGFFDASYVSLPDPANVFFVATGQSGSSPCLAPNAAGVIVATPFNDMSYFYCPVNDWIYIGQELLWQIYSEDGDAAAAAGLAHEWGHHVQQLAGVPEALTILDLTRTENQADCIAGAWTKYVDELGVLEYPDDLSDIDGLMVRIADAEPGQGHGTVSERTRAFNSGFSGGLQACNAFFPAYPLIT